MKKFKFFYSVPFIFFIIIVNLNAFGISGDINHSGRVDGKDLAFLSRYYGENTNAANVAADLNSDGIVNTNDFLILKGNFGKTDAGGAAAWVSDESRVYKIGVDNGTILSTISGFPKTPVINDVNPDTGEAWALCTGSNLIYVISPFVPVEYNVISNSGYHYTYYVPGIKTASLAKGTNAAICTSSEVYHWYNFTPDYVFTNDTNHTFYNEFIGFTSLKSARIYKDKIIWAQTGNISGNNYYYKLYLSAPSVYDVQSGGVYHSSKPINYNSSSVQQVDLLGDLYVKSNISLYKISALSMGVTADRNALNSIWAFTLNPEDNSVWYYSYYYSSDKKLCHVSADMNELILNKSMSTYYKVAAVDNDRKRLWGLEDSSVSNLRRVQVLNYLGNLDMQITNPDFSYLNSLKLFLPKIFSGYPVAKVEANVTKGNYPLTVTFSATNSYDVDGTIVEYAWDFNGDGVFDLSGPDVTVVTNTYNSPGKYSVMLKVTDDDGLVNYDSDTTIGVGPLTVYPNATPTSGVANLNVTFTAEVTDGLGDGNMENYQWDFDNDGVFDYVSLTTPNTSFKYTKAGDYDAHIKVLSKSGEIADATVKIHVESSIPTCILYASPSSITNAQQVQIRVNFNDGDGIIAMLSADLDDDGVFEYNVSPNASSGYKNIENYYSLPGIYHVKAFVIDNDGNHSDTNEVQLTFTPQDYEIVVTPEAVNAVGSVVCTTKPSIISISPDKLTWTISRFNYSNGTEETYFTAEKTETRIDVTDLNIPGAYKASLSYPPLQKEFDVYSPDEPIAAFTATPENGFASLNVNYDASASSSASGISLYEWDFDSAYFYDDAEVDYGVFNGDGERTTAYAYEGSHSWLIYSPGGLGSRYYQIPENDLLKISFYSYITNMGTVRIKLRVYYDNIYGSQSSSDYDLITGTNWNKNIIIHNFINPKPGGQFLLRFYSVSLSIPVYIDNILVTEFGKEFNPDVSSASPTTSYSFQNPGVYNSLLRVTDANGNKCYADKDITVVAKPVILINEPEAGKSYGATVTFSAQAENSGYITAYFWDYTGDGIADEVSTKLESQNYTYSTGGAKSASLYAQLTDGSMLTSTVSFTALLNTSPEVVGYSVSPIKSKINFYIYTYLAVNFNDSDLDYMVWQYNDGAPVTNQLMSDSKYINTAGNYTQKITIVALNGQSTSTQTVIRALPYRCIYISATAYPNPAVKGSPVELNGTLNYYSGAVADSFSWDFNNDGIVDWTSTNSPLVTNTFMTAGSITSKVSVVTTNGVEDYDYLYLDVLDTVQTNSSKSTYFLTSSSVAQPTNYANINANDTLLNSTTNSYGRILQFIRNNYDGSYWGSYYEGYPIYSYKNYHFDKNMNVLGVISNNDEFSVANIPFAPSVDDSGVWIFQQTRYWPYVRYLNKYNGTAQLGISISNPPIRSSASSICSLPDGLVCVASYDGYGNELTIIDSNGVVVNKTVLSERIYKVNYNSVNSNIWVTLANSKYIYSLNLAFAGLVTANNLPMSINPVDGTVLINHYGQIARYAGDGNLINISPTYSVYSDDISVDVSDGGVYSLRYNYVKKYNTVFTDIRTYNSIPFSNYKTVKANGPYYETAPANRPVILGSYSTVTKVGSIEATFAITSSSSSGISSYEWDFDGDGIYDYFSKTTGNTSFEYTQSGEYFPVCRITDNSGIAIADTHLQPINVTAGRDSVNVQLFLTPETALTSPVSVAISTFVESGDVSLVRLYIDNTQIYYKYNPSNPCVYNYDFTLAGDYIVKAEVTVDGKTYTVKKNIQINSDPPVAVINYTTVPKGAPSQVTLDPSSSYASGSSISFVQWDLNNDGVFDRYYEDVTKTVTLLYPTQSSANVKLRITDSMGVYSETNATITVTNSGPVVSLSANPSRGIPPFNSTLTFSALDPDGTVDAYLLDADGNGTINHTATSSGTFLYNYTNNAGTYYPRLYAVDNVGVTGTVSTIVTILPAGSAIAFASAVPNSGPAPLTVNFVGDCTNQVVALYEWDFDGDGVYEWNSTSNGIADYTYDIKRVFSPKFRVTATNGTQDSVELSVSVGIPPIPQPRAMPLQAVAPQTAKFTADGIDPDGTIVNFYWDINDSGTFVYYNPITDSPSSYNYTTPGTYTSWLIAQDDSGLQATGSVTVTVISQTVPTVSASLLPDIVNTGETVSFFGYANDHDGNIAQLKWLFGDGEQNSSTTDGNAFHSYSSTGVYAAMFIATDNDGNSATATAHVTVLVTGWPRATGSVSPDSGDIPLAVSFSIDGIAYDSPIVNYEIDFDDGSAKFSVSSPETVLHNYTEVGTYFPTLTVTASDGRKSSMKLAVSVDGNMSIVFDEEKFDPTLAEVVTANVFMPFDATVTLKVNNQYGVTRRTLWSGDSVSAGNTPVIWDGKDETGDYVSDGTYYYVATYERGGNTFVYDPSYDVPGLSSPSIDKSTVQNKPFTIYSDNPLMIGFTLGYRAEVSLYMAKNPTGVNVTPWLTNRVKTIYHHTPLGAGKQYARWDTTDDNGEIAVDPYSAADFFFYIWNWQLPVNSVIVNSKPKIFDITIEGEPNYYSAGLNPYRDSVTNELAITYSVSKPVAQVTIDIMHFSGQVVRTLTYNNVAKGTHLIKWDARANDGYLTMPDSYKLAISAEDSEGNVSDVVYDLFKLVY